MLNIFIDELKTKKKQYLYTLLNYSVLIGAAFYFNKFFAEYFTNIYNFIIIVMFTGGISSLPNFKKEKMMSIYSKLPRTTMELYLIRLASISIYGILCLIILYIMAIFDKEALSLNNTIGIIIFTFILFVLIIHNDLKIYIQKFNWIKGCLIYITPYIYLIAIIICFVIVMKRNEHLFEFIYIKSLLIIFLISMYFTVSYRIFKLRKSYKF